MENAQTIERCSVCLDNPATASVVAEKCLPVPAFGNHRLDRVKVATIGLNPALNEFFENDEWKQREQRLAILDDYGRLTRESLSAEEIQHATKRRENYFTDARRDWHSYFDSLDCLLGRVSGKWSYVYGTAVHLDLVACATTVRFGMLDDDSQEGLQANCRRHFERTLIQLPLGTLLLFNGVSVHNSIQPYCQKFEARDELITIFSDARKHMGCVGQVEFGSRKFEFRAWSIPVRKLTLLCRHDLAFWLRGTLGFPRFPF